MCGSEEKLFVCHHLNLAVVNFNNSAAIGNESVTSEETIYIAAEQVLLRMTQENGNTVSPV